VKFKKGKIHGLVKEYYKSGILKSKGNYSYSTPIGIHYFYNIDGSLKERKKYLLNEE